MMWVILGLVVLLLGGWQWFAAWLTPGVPPPGPFG